MAYREVSVIQVKEALRRWMEGEGERPIAKAAGIARGTARNYIAAAVALGIDRGGDEKQLTAEVIGQICEAVRPARPDGHGEGWKTLIANEDKIADWVADGLTVTKIGILLKRSGIEVPARTLARFCVERCGTNRKSRITVRVADPEPGRELQVDFGRLGLIPDGDKKRVCQALIFTACYSRHMFVRPTLSMTLDEVIAGFEAAWQFFGGVFPVVIPDSMKTIVFEADNVAPRFNDTFYEYAQDRGFAIDPARIRSPKDKPRVERAVQYVRGNFYSGEVFAGLADVRARAEVWCRDVAGNRIHGTTQLCPKEAFAAQEAPFIGPLPGRPFDLPVWSSPKVHRDHHVEVARAIYSVPYLLVGKQLKARADSVTVKLFNNGELVKVHPKKPAGSRSTDPADFPPGKEIYAMRDVDALKRMAAHHGASIGTYATALLNTDLPWTKMRQAYRLLGLVKKWGADRVEAACERALEAEAIDVNLISRMIERAMEEAKGNESAASAKPVIIEGRFCRDASEFAATREVTR